MAGGKELIDLESELAAIGARAGARVGPSPAPL
jgi:hypothetical protein